MILLIIKKFLLILSVSLTRYRRCSHLLSTGYWNEEENSVVMTTELKIYFFSVFMLPFELDSLFLLLVAGLFQVVSLFFLR